MAHVVCPHYNKLDQSCKLRDSKQDDWQRYAYCITKNWLNCFDDYRGRCPHYNGMDQSCKLDNSEPEAHQRMTNCITSKNWLKCAKEVKKMAYAVCPHYNELDQSCKLRDYKQCGWQRDNYCITSENWLKCVDEYRSRCPHYNGSDLSCKLHNTKLDIGGEREIHGRRQVCITRELWEDCVLGRDNIWGASSDEIRDPCDEIRTPSIIRVAQPRRIPKE